MWLANIRCTFFFCQVKYISIYCNILQDAVYIWRYFHGRIQTGTKCSVDMKGNGSERYYSCSTMWFYKGLYLQNQVMLIVTWPEYITSDSVLCWVLSVSRNPSSCNKHLGSSGEVSFQQASKSVIFIHIANIGWTRRLIKSYDHEKAKEDHWVFLYLYIFFTWELIWHQ